MVLDHCSNLQWCFHLVLFRQKLKLKGVSAEQVYATSWTLSCFLILYLYCLCKFHRDKTLINVVVHNPWPLLNITWNRETNTIVMDDADKHQMQNSLIFSQLCYKLKKEIERPANKNKICAYFMKWFTCKVATMSPMYDQFMVPLSRKWKGKGNWLTLLISYKLGL